MVRVYNREGFTDSPFFRVLNAGKPMDIPSEVVLLFRNETMVEVEMPIVVDDNNVLSYEL